MIANFDSYFAAIVVALLASVLWAGASRHLTGIASWYGEECRGKIMANGKPFDPDALTCASWHYPFGAKLRVTNNETGCWVIVEVCDRGPAKRLNRLIDLSKAAFANIADTRKGLIKVKVS